MSHDVTVYISLVSRAVLYILCHDIIHSSKLLISSNKVKEAEKQMSKRQKTRQNKTKNKKEESEKETEGDKIRKESL